MPLLLTEHDVTSLLTMPDCVDAVEQAFVRQSRGQSSNHPRRRLHAPHGTFHFLEAIDLEMNRAAIKIYASFRPGTRFLVLLYDAAGGELLAMIEAAVDAADILVTVTSSRTPVFDGERLRPGVHVNAAGSNSLARAELDLTAVSRADMIVVDSVDQARMESGDLLAAVEARKVRWEQVLELKDLAGGARAGRSRPEQITLFKSNGIALEDLAAASLVYDRAVAAGAGRAFELWG